MIYAVGNVKNKQLHSLWFVYGDCYYADKSTYERTVSIIKDGLSESSGVALGETNELARVNNIDSLGITYLRIRGMWGIQHRAGIFKSLLNTDQSKSNIYVLMKRETHEEIEIKPDFQDFINEGILEVTDV
ncbi:hypothetical protein A4U60_14400 [Priestia endophytica]|nr:hypothetical protein A4U60_14400 [Priestia endophytica]